jgi:AcrR family transcriptional regulator
MEMPKAVKARRGYVSALRRGQARATRVRILAAAQGRFEKLGYAATTISEIARAAKVSSESIYATFGSKRELLAQMIAVAISGADEAVPMLQRDWVETMRCLPGGAERLRYWIGHTCDTLERTGPVHALIRDAAKGEPALAGLRRQQQDFRLRMQTRLMGLIEEVGGAPLRGSVAKSAQSFWVLTSPELHHLLRVDRGWSKARYRDWLTDALETLLAGTQMSGTGPS